MSTANNATDNSQLQQPLAPATGSTFTPVATNGNNIKVLCRFRPQNGLEEREGGRVVVQIDQESQTNCRVDSKEFSGQFSFDRIFDWRSTQPEVFEYIGVGLIEQVFEGFNSTLFCYGQTGSGKTFTMMGDSGNIDNENTKGLTPRLVEYVFQRIRRSPSNLEFTVRVAFMEIYMERIRDLLNPAMDNLPVHEDRNRGVFVKGLKEVYVASEAEVYELIRLGDQSRSVASTNMNEQSSRSHSIFVMTVNQKDTDTGNNKSGKLYLVDLAGSEKVGKTGATGQTLEEAKKINKSLTALGMVINALTDGKSIHVPYRDSKLTRILQESLGGNSKTTLLINCSPSSFNDAETISTLRFGTRAKQIKNTAHINVELSSEELKAMLKKASAQLQALTVYIADLEAELAVWRSGGQIPVDKQAFRGQTQQLSQSPITAFAFDATSPQISTPIGQIGSPAIVVPIDDKEEFMQRENQLMDQLAEKEVELEQKLKQVALIESELRAVKEKELSLAQAHGELVTKCGSLELHVEKLTMEKEDMSLLLDTVNEASQSQQNRIAELESELQKSTKSQVELQAKLAHEQSEAALKQKISVMVKDVLEASGEGATRLSAPSSPKKAPTMGTNELTDLIQRKNDEIEQLRSQLAALSIPSSPIDMNRRRSSQISLNADSDPDAVFKALDKERKEHLATKRKYMADLQDRCAKVVELEMKLDDLSERHSHLLRANSSKSQQNKMELLERNLEQLSKVQKQLVDQNKTMRQSLLISDKKIMNRNERIGDLERMLQALNEKLGHSEEQHMREVAKLRTKLDELQVENQRLTMTQLDSRIAKPLRGGT